MTAGSIIRLLSLAAIWGASFLFMRLAVPELGPAWLMFGRVLLASLFLALVALAFKRSLPIRQYAGHFMLLSFFNTALPFLLFAWAAQTLTASLLAVLNATAPLWGALIGWLFFRQPMSAKVALGLLLGITGVAILVGFDAVLADSAALPAIAAGAAAGTHIDLSTAETAVDQAAVRYDRQGDEHYDVISAFIKSVRGSDADAAIMYLARMIEAGEDPRFIARRLVILAAEDIGLADPAALTLAVSAADAAAYLGLPEARIPLAEATIYLALAPKSNSAPKSKEAAKSSSKYSNTAPKSTSNREDEGSMVGALG